VAPRELRATERDAVEFTPNDLEALADKLDAVDALNDQDRILLLAIFGLASEGIDARCAEVSGFGAGGLPTFGVGLAPGSVDPPGGFPSLAQGLRSSFTPGPAGTIGSGEGSLVVTPIR
jgi:hypothetical protein